MWAMDAKLRYVAISRLVVRAWAALVLASLAWPALSSPDAVPAAAKASADTLVFVVRHAEKVVAPVPPGKAGHDDDPPLTTAGEARAAALAVALADARVGAIYSTPFRRTRATAAPLAARTGVVVTPYDPHTPVRELARDVLREHRGRTVLIVGHSNTVPDIVEAFAGTRVEPIEDAMYGRLYLVSIDAAGAARLLRLGFPPGQAETAP